MAKYRIEGQVVEAASPDEAYALVDEQKRVAKLGPLRQFGEAAVKAVPEIGGRVGNFMGLGHIAPGSFGREAVEAQGRRNQPLRNTNAGYLGGFAGDTAAGMAAGGGVATGANLLRQVGMKTAGKLLGSAPGIGAVSTAAMSRPGERTEGTVQGGVAGAAFPAAGAALRRIANPAGAIQEAKDLVNRGVNLTAGQMNPESWGGQLESALQSVGYFGRKLANRRAEPVGQFYREVATEAGPVGFAAKDASKADLVQQLRDAYGLSYDDAIKAYTQLEPVIKNTSADIPLGPRQMAPGQPKVPGALEGVTRQGFPGTFVTNQDRARAAQNIRNQLTGVGQRQTSGAELQALRSNLRESGREGSTPGERKISRSAADKVTESIESQITPDDAAKLRATDARYPGKLAFEDAVRAAGDRPWPTPFQLSNAIKGVADEGGYATGGGAGANKMRELATAGRKVFSDTPETGARQVTVGKFPGTKAATAVAINQIPSEILAGLTKPQQRVANFLISMKGFDDAYPIIAAMAKNAPAAATQAGE